jgi:starch synthase
VLYDGVDWQKRAPFKPKISKVGSKFVVEYLFEHEPGTHPRSVVLLLKSFIFDFKSHQNVTSWHKPELIEYVTPD